MAKVTYNAPAGDDKVVTYMGHELYHGQAVEIDDPAVIKKASKNPHFTVTGVKAKAEKQEADEVTSADKLDAVKAKGAKAKEDGKDRNVPVAYRGKPEEAAWLSGYDGEAV
jgi:hypothetical protein